MKTRTRVQLDFVIEHDGKSILPSFNMLDFIQAGMSRVELPAPGSLSQRYAILPGSRLTLRLDKRKRAP